MRHFWSAKVLAGALAVAGILGTGAQDARAQFPIFFGGTVLQPNGRKLGIPPSSPRRPSDYPYGSSGFSGQFPPQQRRRHVVRRPTNSYTTPTRPTYVVPSVPYYTPYSGYYVQQPAYGGYTGYGYPVR